MPGDNAAKKVGVAIHTLEPEHHKDMAFDLVPRIMDALSKAGFNKSQFAARVKLQSFHLQVCKFTRKLSDWKGGV